jgi:hypothetical protein
MTADARTRRLRELVKLWRDIIKQLLLVDALDYAEGMERCAEELEAELAAVLDTEGDRPEPVSPWDSHGQIRWKGDASPARPDFVRMFLSKLPDMACAEVRLEEDGDVGFDWDHSKHRTLTASVSTTGRVSWAALIHDWKAYGHFDMPDWPSDFAEALERIDVAEALPDPPVQP